MDRYCCSWFLCFAALAPVSEYCHGYLMRLFRMFSNFADHTLPCMYHKFFMTHCAAVPAVDYAAG